MKKTILVAILGVLLLTSSQKHPAKNISVNKQKMALALNAQYYLGISPDLVLPFDSAGMDSLLSGYKAFFDVTPSDSAGEEEEEEGEDEICVDEKMVDIYIPYAFNDLVKHGFKPISNEQFEQRLAELGIDSMQRKSLPYVFDHQHYFTVPSCVRGWSDRTESERKSLNDENYVKFSCMNDFFIKGYNFISSPPMDIESVRQIHGKMCFRLSNDIIHINRFLFNNDKESFLWLCKYAPLWLKDLFVTYGYDKNELINRQMLKRMMQELRSDMWYSDLRGTRLGFMYNTFARKIYTQKPYVAIREGLFKTLLQLPTSDKNSRWMDVLDLYGETLLKKDLSDCAYWFSQFIKNERYMIAAYTAYYLIKLREKYNRKGAPFYDDALRNDNRFRQYLEKQHYFNLPGFDKMSENILNYNMAVAK